MTLAYGPGSRPSEGREYLKPTSSLKQRRAWYSGFGLGTALSHSVERKFVYNSPTKVEKALVDRNVY